jgi:DNA replication protein DnaC
LKAYPFFVEIWDGMQLLASHPRCYQREQDLFDPLHYLPLLEQRPGAFDYAKPLKQWRKGWPAVYHQMLASLRQKWPDGRGVQEFVRILQLHQTYTPEQMEQAIKEALTLGCSHLDGVLYCLRQITGSASPQSTTPIANLDLSHRPDLDAVGKQPIDLSCYDRLLKQSQVGKTRFLCMQSPHPHFKEQDHRALLEAYLKTLNLPMFLEHYQAYAKDAMRSGQSPERFLLALCEAETGHRDAQRIERAITQAKLPFLKELSTYDFGAIESIQKTRVLELAQGGYMQRAENILLLGAPGLGKTHLAIGLALAACREGKRVRFYRVAKLVDDLLVHQHNLSLSRFSAKFERLDLLVLDELGFFPVAQEGAQLLFQLCSDLYERVSMIVTSNLRFGEWNHIFADEKLTAAFIDRLTHKGYILEFVGESYRYRHRLEIPDTGSGEIGSEKG